MRHLFIAAMLSAASLSSWAQAYSPAIAYTKSTGNTFSIYLANADGSRAVAVYTSRTGIWAIDLAPGGGRVAISQADGLRVLSYTASNAGITVNGISRLDSSPVGRIDFSPDGSKILYTNLGANEIRVVSAAGGPSTPLLWGTPGSSSLQEVAWLPSGTSFVYTVGDAASLTTALRGADVDGAGNVTPWIGSLLVTGSGVNEIVSISTARTRDSVLMRLADGSGPIGLVECPVVLGACGSLQTRVPGGEEGRFSSDDSSIVYVDFDTGFVSRYTIGTNTTVRLTKRGSFGKVDTLPPTPAP